MEKPEGLERKELKSVITFFFLIKIKFLYDHLNYLAKLEGLERKEIKSLKIEFYIKRLKKHFLANLEGLE